MIGFENDTIAFNFHSKVGGLKKSFIIRIILKINLLGLKDLNSTLSCALDLCYKEYCAIKNNLIIGLKKGMTLKYCFISTYNG